jgi:hypothetical protein
MKRSASGPGPSRLRRLPWAWGSAIAALTALLYWRAPWLGFTGDDALVLYHLRRLGGIQHAAAFFSALDFFSYYRPLGFLSFAGDAAAWGLRPGGFHLTNIVLHATNAVLVLALGRRLLPPWAAGVAAALFLVHASNQEAVYWISARFDLMATLGTLATVLLATRREAAWIAVSLGTFALALLSKEAALAAPVVVGAYLVFVERARPRRVVVVLALMLGVVAAYSLMRSVVGGLDATGGASRLPKALMLIGATGLLMILARGGWERAVAMVAAARPGPAALAGVGFALVAALVSLMPELGAGVREKLSFAGFAAFYLVSPVVAPPPPPYFLDQATPVYWVGGIAAGLSAAGLIVALGRRFASDGVGVFLLAFTAAALLPVSSLMEGQRYLYMGSVGVSLGVGWFVAGTGGRVRRVALAAIGVVFAVSAWQVQVKGADWAWASGMTSRGAALVNSELPACGQGDVVFLVAPVGIRGVYSHFYHQTFSQDGGCEPGSYQAIVRMVRTDQPIEVRWISPRTVVVRAPHYRGNFMLSRDLREFTLALRSTRQARFLTPLGLVTAKPDGDAEEVTLELAPAVEPGRLRFYCFSGGEVRRAGPAWPGPAGR